MSLLIAALALIPLLAVGALAIDLGFARANHRTLSSSADAGALAGALEIGESAEVHESAAEVAALDTFNGELPTITAASLCDAALEPVPSTGTECFTATIGSRTAAIAVAHPYSAASVPNPTTTDPSQLVWVRVCRTQQNTLAGLMGHDTLDLCADAVARHQPGSPFPAIFAMKERVACNTGKGIVGAGVLKVYDSAGNPTGTIQSNCPVNLSGTTMDNVAPANITINSAEGFNPSSGPNGSWGTIDHNGSEPYLDDPFAAPTVPDFDNVDCYPDDATKSGCPMRSGPSTAIVSGVRVWQPGIYASPPKPTSGQIHYFLPGVYRMNGSFGWDAGTSLKIYTMTNNGTTPLDSTSLNPNCASLIVLGYSCPPPPTGTPSTSNRGGGAMFYLAGPADWLGAKGVRTYPVRTGPYAGISYMCHRNASGTDQNQFDGPMGAAPTYDLTGIFYCPTREIEMSGNVNITNGLLWANNLEFENSANVSVRTPGNLASPETDVGLEW